MAGTRRGSVLIKNFFSIAGAAKGITGGIQDTDMILFNRVKSNSSTQRSTIADMQFMVQWGDFRSFILENVSGHALYDNIAARDADPGSSDQGAVSYVRNATNDPIIGQNVFAFYIYDAGYILLTSGEGVVYQSNSSDLTTAIASAGTFLQGITKVGDLRNLTFTKFIDKMLFVSNPTKSNNSGSYVINTPASTVEVGTVASWISTASYNQGSITNGDLSPGPTLTGPPNKYTFTNPDATTTDYNTPNLSQGHTAPSPYTMALETKNVNAQIFYDAGTGIYTDSTGNPSNIYDPDRVAGSLSLNSSIIGRYNAWDGFGVQNSAPTTSAGVRALGSKRFLNSSNSGSFSISIPATTQEVYFFIPIGKSVTVNYVESSNADVTGSFVVSPITVDDANAVGVGYESWVSFIGSGGFPDIATYNVTIT